MAEAARKLSRSETHDLSMIIKDRTKVLRAAAEEQAAACLAEFETKMAAVHAFDDDATWKQAAEAAEKAVAAAQDTIAKRCKQLGIPKQFAPALEISWRGRGENAIAARRTELRRVAQAQVAAMTKAAVTRIEKESLDLRTQVVAMGLLSPEASAFLNTLAPVENSMRAIDFAEIEKKLADERTRNLAVHRSYFADLDR